MSVAVDFKSVDIVFGTRTAEALKLLDAGRTRAEKDPFEQPEQEVLGEDATIQAGDAVMENRPERHRPEQ